MSEVWEGFFGWYMVERDLVDIEGVRNEIPLPIRLGGSGERRVVNCQRGLGQSPVKNVFGAFYLAQNPSGGRKIQSVYL